MARLTIVPTVRVTPPPNPGPPIALPCAANQALLIVPPPQHTRRQRLAWISTQAQTILAKTSRRQSTHPPGERSAKPPKLEQKRTGSVSFTQTQSSSTRTPTRRSVHSPAPDGDMGQLILDLQRLEGNNHIPRIITFLNTKLMIELTQSTLSKEKENDLPPQSTLLLSKQNAKDQQLTRRTLSQRCTLPQLLPLRPLTSPLTVDSTSTTSSLTKGSRSICSDGTTHPGRSSRWSIGGATKPRNLTGSTRSRNIIKSRIGGCRPSLSFNTLECCIAKTQSN